MKFEVKFRLLIIVEEDTLREGVIYFVVNMKFDQFNSDNRTYLF